MTEVGYDILTAYYELLDGNVGVPVYKGIAPASEVGNYLMLRFESESTEGNNSAFLKNPVIIVEAVTFGSSSVNVKTTWDIMKAACALILPTPGTVGMSVTGFQLYEASDNGTSEVLEDQSTPMCHRLIKRFLNRSIAA